MDVILSDYGLALAGVMVLVIISLVQAGHAAIAKGKAGLPPGATPPADFNDRAFRLDRAHMNSLEMLAPIVATVFGAIVVGIGATLLAAYVWLGVAARLVAWVFHAMEGQKAIQGPRSMAYVFIVATTFLLAATVLVKGVL